MRVLMVTPYPPVRDGIAAYAVQAVAGLRAAGHDVEVLSPTPSAAHHHLDLLGPRGALALAKRVRSYDRVVVQFHPDVFFPVPAGPRQRLQTAAALALAFRLAAEVEVRVHEVDYRWGRRHTPDGLAVRQMWRAVDRIVVHTEVERAELVRAFGVSPGRVAVVEHGAHFVRRTTATRGEARASLGIPEDAFAFLSIGFIQPHKGFDRAVRAFSGLATAGARLDVVGSVRVEDPSFVRYAAELQELVDRTEGAHLHLGYVSDERFDRWLAACDVVVLPYRTIWSSGVIERAALYRCRVIATDVGGLSHQLADRDDVELVPDDDEALAAALWRAVGRERAAVTRGGWPEPGPRLRERVQQEVVSRALRRRGGRLVGDAPGGGAVALAASEPLRRLPPLVLPPPTSSRPGIGLVKRVVRRLSAWQTDPLVAEVNALRQATIAAVERLGAARGSGEVPPVPANPRDVA